MIRYKDNGFKVMDIDERHKKVQMYVSSFNNLDSDGDIIVPGAYKKTLKERGPRSEKPRIKHLRDHFTLVGKPLEMEEDEKGLLVLSQISNSTAGQDLMEDYKLDMFEHSIGYEIIKSEPGKNNANMLLELALWEYSSVTWGANSETPTIGVSKGILDEDYLEKLNTRMDKCVKALRYGNYTDDRFEEIELQLNFLKSQYNGIIDSLKKPHDSTEEGRDSGTSEHEPNLEDLEKIFDNFKSKFQ